MSTNLTDTRISFSGAIEFAYSFYVESPDKEVPDLWSQAIAYHQLNIMSSFLGCFRGR